MLNWLWNKITQWFSSESTNTEEENQQLAAVDAFLLQQDAHPGPIGNVEPFAGFPPNPQNPPSPPPTPRDSSPMSSQGSRDNHSSIGW